MNIKELDEKVRYLKSQLANTAAQIEDEYQRMQKETGQADPKKHAVNILVLETQKKALAEQVQSAERELGERESFFKSKEYKDLMRQIVEHEKTLKSEAAGIRETIDSMTKRIEKSISIYLQYAALAKKCEAARDDEAYSYLSLVYKHTTQVNKRTELIQSMKGR